MPKQRKPDPRVARMGTKMDRIATAIMIAGAALVMSGGLVRQATAEDSMRPPRLEAYATVKSPTPVTIGLRSDRVMSLLLLLEALRAAPATITSPKG